MSKYPPGPMLKNFFVGDLQISVLSLEQKSIKSFITLVPGYQGSLKKWSN
jgi:hypothetical protein